VSSNRPTFDFIMCFCIIYLTVSVVVVSVCATEGMQRQSDVGGGTAPMCLGWRCTRLGFGNSNELRSTRRWVVEFSVPPGPHQGAPVVFGYTYVHANNVHLIFLGA
jgi:hypothetical protein